MNQTKYGKRSEWRASEQEQVIYWKMDHNPQSETQSVASEAVVTVSVR